MRSGIYKCERRDRHSYFYVPFRIVAGDNKFNKSQELMSIVQANIVLKFKLKIKHYTPELCYNLI